MFVGILSLSQRQSIQQKNPSIPTSKKDKFVSSAGKMVTSVFEDAKVIVINYLQKGHPTNVEYYAEIKRPRKMWKGVLFHQDNPLAHVLGCTVCCAWQKLWASGSPSPFLLIWFHWLFPTMAKVLIVQPVWQWRWCHMMLLTFLTN